MVESVTITLHCWDCRDVQMVFTVRDNDDEQAFKTKRFFKVSDYQ